MSISIPEYVIILKEINGIIAIAQGCVFAVVAIFYWRAYLEMKKTPIIGWVAKIATASSACALVVGISLIIINAYSLIITAMLRIIVTVCALSFIKASLSSNEDVKSIEKISKKIKKN